MHSFPIPEHIQKLVPYVPGKPIEETQREYGLKRVIKLASNENPLGPSPRALAAIKKALKNLQLYPDATGFHLKRAIAKYLKVEAKQILLGNGSNEVIDLIFQTFCMPGDKMVTSQAAFLAYAIGAQSHGLQTIFTPLTADLRFDLDEMLKVIHSDFKVRMVFIANPNNPTGTYVTRQELERFLAEVTSLSGRSVLVIIDAAYQEYITARDLPDPLEYVRKYPQVMILRTFSKVYGMAGLRLGYGVGHPDLIGMMERAREPFNVNSLALVAGIEALKDVAFVKKTLKANRTGMKFLEKEFRKMGLKYWPSQGNFFLVDVEKKCGKTGPEIFQECLKHGVIFRPVVNYGFEGALRISVGTMEENRMAVRVLKKVLS